MAKETLEGFDENQLDEFMKDAEEVGHIVEILQNTEDSSIRTIISKLRELADYSDKIGLDVKIADTVGNGVGIAGSLLFISGSGVAAAGGLTSVGANITSAVATNNTIAEAKPILEELKVLLGKLATQLQASVQALKRLEANVITEAYWTKAPQTLPTSSSGKLTDEEIVKLVEDFLESLPDAIKQRYLTDPQNMENFVNGISAFYAIKEDPVLAQQAEQLCRLSDAARSSPDIISDVSTVTTILKGASPVVLSATQRTLGGVFAGAAILTSTMSIVDTWTSSNETPAATELRRIANELEKAYPSIQP